MDSITEKIKDINTMWKYGIKDGKVREQMD